MEMSSENLQHLHDIWVKFLNTKSTDEGENWLDAFLARYLTLFCYNEIPPNHDFSFQYKYSANVLVHQLLTDVYQICEDIEKKSSPENENEISAEYFKSYLLQGRGWKILWTLDKIGVRHLMHLKELVMVLISQMPVLLTLPVESSVIPECLERKPKHLDLSSCFYTSNRPSNISRNVDLRKPEVYLPLKRNFQGKKRVRRKKIKPEIKNNSSSSEEQDVMFESCYIPASQVKSFMKIKGGTNNGGSSSDSNESSHMFIGSDTSVASNVSDFETYSISVIDYIAFNLNIFQECVVLDAKFRDIDACTSPPVIEFSFRMLREIHTNKYKFVGWPEETVADFKNRLLDLLFLSSNVARISFGYNAAPNANEIISTLFLISEEIMRLPPGCSLTIKDILFLSHILKGCLMLVRNIIETCNGDYAKVICIVRTFSDSGGNLCCNIFSLLERQITTECENELKIIIPLVKDIIITLKLLRTTATYSSDDMCDIKDYIHHHNDIFGPPVSHSIINKDPMCSIAAMSCLLLKLFSASLCPKTSNEILKNLKMCGICCCVNPSFILKSLFDGYASRDPETQKLILVMLGKHLFPQLGLVSKCQKRCSYCSKYLTTSEFLPLDKASSDSIAHGVVPIIYPNADTSDSFELIFNIYSDLLNLSDDVSLENVSRHLIEVFSICVSELKTQIFVRVIVPQLLHLKIIPDEPITSIMKIKIKCILSILPHILSNSALYSVFISFKGIPIIFPFLSIAEFRELTLAVIKILILSESESGNTYLPGSFELDTLPSTRTFSAFIADHSEVFFQKLSLVIKLSSKYIDLLAINGESLSLDSAEKSTFTVVEEFPEDVNFICDIWNSFKELVLIAKLDTSSGFFNEVLTSGYNLLILLLKNLSVILKIKTVVQNGKVEEILLLIQSLITILVNVRKEVQHKQSVLEVVKHNLKTHAPDCIKYQKMLFSLVLKCCFWSNTAAAPIRQLHKHVGLEREIIDSVTSSDKEETEVSANGESYAADTEGSNGSSVPEMMKDQFLCENFIEHGEFVKMLCELVADLQTENSYEWISTSLYFMQILNKLCHDCGLNKTVLCNHDIPSLLLDIFSKSLIVNQKNLKEFQTATMDLFVVLTESSMKVIYIKRIIGFFKIPYAPVDILLKSLNNMVDKIIHHPTWYVTFPCIQKSNTGYLKVKKRLRASYIAYKQYDSVENTPSAWTSAALIFPLSEDTKWNALNKGFNLTLWLRMNRSSDVCKSAYHSRENSLLFKDDSIMSVDASRKGPLLHILSLGSDKFLIEFWCGKYSSDLIIRISSYINGEVTLLAEGTCPLLLQYNVWHHIAIIYSEETEKSVFTSKFQIIVDGLKEKICNLKYRRTGIKSLNKCHLLVGSSIPGTEKSATSISYSIANFCLFKDNVLTKHLLYYLSSCGPDVSGITNCAAKKPSKFVPKNNNFQNFVSPSNIDIVSGNKIPSLDSFQNSILCSFCAEYPNIYLVYPTVPRGFFPLHFSARGKSRLSSFDEWPYQKQPLDFACLSLAVVHSHQYCGFEYAVQNAGGIRIFLFLFANVLEYFASEENLSAALDVILKLLNKSTAFVEDFIGIKGYELLFQMINNAKCRISSEFLQIFIQNCMIYTYPEQQSVLSDVGNLTVIKNTLIFNLMFKSLAFATHSPPAVTTGLFSVLDLLLNPKHSNLNINVEQLMSIQTLNVLMWLLKRNYIMFEHNYLPSAVVKMIPIIIEKLLIYKYDVKILQNVICMLLMLHRASSTYVCHSPSSFFFLTPRDKNIGTSRSSFSKASVVSTDKDEADSLKNPTLRRSSSFSSIISEREKCKLQKSASLEFLPDNLITDSEYKLRGVEDHILNILGSTETNDNNFSHDKTDSALHTEFNRSRSAEVTQGLLRLLYNFITSENISHVQALLEIIKPEIFIVLAYTPSSEVCAAVIKVIDAYLKTTTEEKRHEFLSMKGFHLLANQLYQSPAHPEVVDACFSIIFDRPLSTADLYVLFENASTTSFQILSWIPILALLPNTYMNDAISDRIITFLSKFLHLGTVVIMELLENGLCVSLINLVVKICLNTDLESGEDIYEKHSSIKKIGHLLKFIAQDLCSSRSSKGFLCFVDCLQMFSAWERNSQEKYGPESLCVTCLRNYQSIMFEILVEFSEIYNLPKNNSHRFNDDTSLWELVVELQGTFGTFSSISMPQSSLLTQVQVHNAIEAEELDMPLSVEAEKSMNEVPITDIIDRLLYLVEKAADFFVFKDFSVKIGSIEKDFFKTYFQFLIEGMTVTLDKRFKVLKTKNSAIMFALRDTLKKQLGRILVSSVASPQDIFIKTCVTEVLSSHPLVAKILQFVVYSIAKVGTFLIFLYDIQAGPRSKLQKQCFLLFSVIKQLLENSQHITVLYDKESMEKMKKSWLDLWNEDRHKWLSICDKGSEKMFQKMEFLAQDISTMALYVTQQVFEIQNTERKFLIEELKTKYYEEACERMTWLELCEQMTHERAIWHMKDYYPFTWEMDPTEGPARVRRRLRRCHVHIPARFFQPDYAEALNNLVKETPFVTLLTHQNEIPDSAVVLHKLFRDEQIKFTCPCKIVTAFEEIAVEILIGAYCIHIIGESTSSHNTTSPLSESWPFESIKEIIPRRYELLNNAFEIFLTNGITHMIAFNSEKDFNLVWKQLQSEGLPCETNKDPLVITQLWRDGSITNYEYLTHLNKLAGRTFNDLMQYPVFPFILSNYVSYFLNLKDPSSFRILAKPIAVQLEKKEQHYRDTYATLSEQYEIDSSLPYIGPYHYGSHYSNSGTVLHFLIRLLPFTYGFITYQDKSFDCADRTFHNLATSWELVTEKSSSDVKELIPEFFFLPEFLCNRSGFDFGITQSGIRVNDVILPPWCKQNARLFILIHRQALESETVTNNLHGWIDLIFGFKQTGEAAVNALNVFHPSTYFGMDRNKYSDPIKRAAFRTMIRTLGNMPQQLFFNPHPMVSLTLAGLDLVSENADKIEVIDTVQGLRWGNYVGSPATGTPSLVWCRKQSIILGSFLPLLTNYVFGLGENVCLLLNHKKDLGSGISKATYIMSAALVSWGHRDGIIRIKLCRDQPSLPLLKGSSIDPICLCASVPDCKHLFVGHSSGIINAYTLELNASELAVTEKQPTLQLNGHSDAVTSIYICKAFSVVASASLDKTVIIWDLNRLCYVRTLSDFEGPVTLVCVSDTLGDVAAVCTEENNAGSTLRVYTINGDFVGRVQIFETVTALCYSTAPEGLSVNVIATGLNNGVIRLWSSWDLKLVRTIVSERCTLPIRCLSFSADNQHLYASSEDGTVTVWEKPSRGLTSVPRLLVFT